ncbi:MAG: hypothetical protein M3379_16035 [Acidobacteriota bacterium]|nr:hypothetical protein [Acidobacteriota bacterium]
MSEYEDLSEGDVLGERPVDPIEVSARESLRAFFEQNRNKVFFSRQLEVINEDVYFHWITYRAMRELEAEGMILSEVRKLKTGAPIRLAWHKSFRYYKRSASNLVKVVDEYSNPIVGAALGLHAEMLILEGFARNRFLMMGRNTREYGDNLWDVSEHDLDFIFERDGIAYGVEIKNTLRYMDEKEFLLKIRLCRKLGIRPVFVVRMMPKSWINNLRLSGGFALILKYQLYPWSHHQLAKKVARELGLPVDAPRAIEQGTMNRFLKWHQKLA